MAYDAAAGYILALSPNYSSGPNGSYFGTYADTWTFSGGTWSELSLPVNPSDRAHGAVAYDAKDREVVLFGGGGLGGNPGLLNDTWAFTNGAWTNLTPNVTRAPSPRYYADMVWDASDQYVLLYGGFGVGGNHSGNLSDTWSFSGTTWTPVASSVYPPFEGAMAYDSSDGYVVHFGGTTVANYVTNLSDSTWTFHAGSWRNLTSVVGAAPPGRALPMLSDDPNLGGALLFGGNTGTGYSVTNDSWSYVNQTWALLSLAAGPSPRYDGQMAFDAADNESILFGGTNLTGAFGDTWAFRAGGNASNSWSQAAPVLHASHRTVDAGMSVTFSAASIFGSGAAQFSYTGLPPGCPSADSRALVCVPTTAGDYTVQMTAIVSGGTSVAFATLQVNPELRILSLGSSFPLGGIDLTQTASIALEISGGVGPYTYAYPTLPPGCTSQNSSELLCTPDAPGSYEIVANAVDTYDGLATDTGTLVVNAWPSIGSFAANSSNVTLGGTLTLRTTAGGGTGSLTYAYAGLPAGCVSANVSVLACSPTVSGTYTVTLSIRDAVGGSATSGPLTIHVAAADRVGVPRPVSGSAQPLFTTSFAVGLLLGLLVLAAVAAALLRSAREHAEGQRIVAELGRPPARTNSPDAVDKSSPDAGPTTP